MTYTDIIARELHAAGWSHGHSTSVDEAGEVVHRVDAHKAGVVGDTVGDPFKDTAGPSLNTLITVMSLVSSLFAPIIAAFHLF